MPVQYRKRLVNRIYIVVGGYFDLKKKKKKKKTKKQKATHGTQQPNK